jgi:N6-L-threonylcarbamoyladenine synthase
MRTLGIETSCDETAAAVVEPDGTVLSDVVHSQIQTHAPYGGVVPELASRDHLRNIEPVVRAALERAGVGLEGIGGIAVTCRPGLSGALLVGLQAARGLAWATNKPIVGVDHLVGHLMAAFLRFPGAEVEKPQLPFVALLASGGHTALYRVDDLDIHGVRELGATRDDAAGEAFDKVAKLLGLGYPGGPIIDRLARDGDPKAVAFALPMPQHGSFEFSFSGLKTNVARWVAEHGIPESETGMKDLCASFQRRVVDSLVSKAVRATRSERLDTLVLGGGVAANRELRERMARVASPYGIRVVCPTLRACTDNAAMIALAGSFRLARGDDERDTITMSPHTVLATVTRKGPGRRARPLHEGRRR